MIYVIEQEFWYRDGFLWKDIKRCINGEVVSDAEMTQCLKKCNETGVKLFFEVKSEFDFTLYRHIFLI